MLKMLSKEDENIHHDDDDSTILHSHTHVYEKYSGKVEKLREGFAEVHLTIIKNMLADNIGLIHNGCIFSSASLAAVAAVNERYGFVIGSITHFLTPIREDDKVIFKAKSRHKIGRKRVVDVIGRIQDVKVFIGEFSVAIMEQHILNLKLEAIDMSEKRDDEEQEL